MWYRKQKAAATSGIIGVWHHVSAWQRIIGAWRMAKA